MKRLIFAAALISSVFAGQIANAQNYRQSNYNDRNSLNNGYNHNRENTGWSNNSYGRNVAYREDDRRDLNRERGFDRDRFMDRGRFYRHNDRRVVVFHDRYDGCR